MYPQVSKHFQFSWCLPHKKKDHDYLWEVHGLNFSTILHFTSHTYYVVCNASKWGYILFSLLGWEFLLGICHNFEPLLTTIVLKECIFYGCLKVVFVSGSGLLLNILFDYDIMAISQRILLSIDSDSKNREINGITGNSKNSAAMSVENDDNFW